MQAEYLVTTKQFKCNQALTAKQKNKEVAAGRTGRGKA